MFQSKFAKCAILPTLLLMLFISPNLAAGVQLESEDNVSIKCGMFWETVTISNTPGEVEVRFGAYNITAEEPTQQLKLTVASYSDNLDENNIEVQDLTYGTEILVDQIENDPIYLDYFGVYLHQFHLIFDPPISERERTLNIHYTTTGSKWDSDKINMILYVAVWSPKIVLEENSHVYVEGDGEGFKINQVWEPWENWTYYNNNQGLRVVINPTALISDSYNRYIHVRYTPAYPSQWYVWDQYQKVAEALQKTENILISAQEGINETRNWAIIGIIVTAIFSTVGSLFFTRISGRASHGRETRKKEIGSLLKTKKQMQAQNGRENLELLYRVLQDKARFWLNIAITLLIAMFGASFVLFTNSDKLFSIMKEIPFGVSALFIIIPALIIAAYGVTASALKIFKETQKIEHALKLTETAHRYKIETKFENRYLRISNGLKFLAIFLIIIEVIIFVLRILIH